MSDESNNNVSGWMIWIGLILFANLLSWLFDWSFWVY